MAIKELIVKYDGVFGVDPACGSIKKVDPLNCSECDKVIGFLHNPTLTDDGDGLVLFDIVSKEVNKSCQFVYTLSYDDAVLVNPSVPLKACDLKSTCCHDCIAQYVDAKIAEELDEG